MRHATRELGRGMRAESQLFSPPRIHLRKISAYCGTLQAAIAGTIELACPLK
jgi:hypothetical protein